jgi:hypothetical protein
LRFSSATGIQLPFLSSPCFQPPDEYTENSISAAAKGGELMRRVLYLLGQLSDENIEWMIAQGKRENIPAGTVLIEEGKPSALVYIVDARTSSAP